MRPVELKKDIYWVGAVDFDIRNFHHYSRSPEGSTYNAYLVCDEKKVLFDTVNAHEFETLVKHISEIIDPEASTTSCATILSRIIPALFPAS